jgi:hypothetical protein
MTTSYLLVLKVKNVMSSTISKVLLFNNPELAYEYAINLDTYFEKHKINPLDKALKKKVIWKSDNKEFPIHVCKIISIKNDIIWNIYQNIYQTKYDNNIMKLVYKELKMYNII